MKVWKRLGIGTLVVALVVAGGLIFEAVRDDESASPRRSEAATSASQSDAEGWLWRAPSETMFLSLLTVGSSVSGTAQVVYLSDDRLTVETRNGPVTGSVSGSQVVLDVLGQTWSGRFDNDALVLSIFDAQGRLRDVRLVPGDGREFNTEIERVEATAQENQRAAQAAADAEADASYRWSLYTQTQSATSDLASVLDLSDLWTDADNQIGFLEEAVAAAATSDCYYAAFDYSSAQFAIGTLDLVFGGVESRIRVIGDRIARLEPLVQSLDSIVTHGDSGDLAFAAADADATIAAAHTVISEQTAMIDATRAQATDLVAQVKQRLAQRCGDDFGG